MSALRITSLLLSMSTMDAVYAAKSGPDCIDPDLAKIDKGIVLTLCNGDQAEGEREPLAACSQDGQQGCLANDDFRAAAVTSFSAAHLLIGQTIAGIEGSLQILPGVIRKGVVIGGVTGDYPSSDFPLAGATGTADLSGASDLAVAGQYEFFDSHGARVVIDGDSDLANSNFKTGTAVEMLSLVGTAVLPDPSDVRYGAAIDGSQGALKTNCRSLGHNATFNSDGLPPITANPGGSGALDWWDTVDTFNISMSALEAISGDLGWGDGSTCIGASFNQQNMSPLGHAVGGDHNWDYVFKEQFSGLLVTNVLYSDSGAALNWANAVSMCDTLSDPTYGSDWRLPTQKEMSQLWVNGLYGLNGGNIGNLSGSFWSSTTLSQFTSFSFRHTLSHGGVYQQPKNSDEEYFLCVQ